MPSVATYVSCRLCQPPLSVATPTDAISGNPYILPSVAPGTCRHAIQALCRQWQLMCPSDYPISRYNAPGPSSSCSPPTTLPGPPEVSHYAISGNLVCMTPAATTIHLRRQRQLTGDPHGRHPWHHTPRHQWQQAPQATRGTSRGPPVATGDLCPWGLW